MTDLPGQPGERPPGLYLHARTRRVEKARAEFDLVMLGFLDAHDDLTDIELASIVVSAAAIPIKYALRFERHGTTEKKADEA